MTKSSSRKIAFGKLQITKVYDYNRQDGAKTFQIEQEVSVVYGGANSRFSKLENFNKLTGRVNKTYSKKRIFFLTSVLEEVVLDRLLSSKEFRNARIIYIYDNSPIIESGHEYAIANNLTTLEDIASKQLLQDNDGNLILDAFGNKIYRISQLGSADQTDVLNGVVFAGSRDALELITEE